MTTGTTTRVTRPPCCRQPYPPDHIGCTMTGVDLSPAFVDAAT